MNKERNNLWHKPTEKPSKQRVGYIYFITIYKNRRYGIDSGWYCSKYDYVALEETKVYWNEIYLWCYDSEFSKIIQTTFRKRQRIYHLRKNTRWIHTNF